MQVTKTMPQHNKQSPFAESKLDIPQIPINMVKVIAGQGTLVRPPHLQLPSPTQWSDRRIRPFISFTAVDSRWCTRGYHRFIFGTFPCMSDEIWQKWESLSNIAASLKIMLDMQEVGEGRWRSLIEFWNDSNFARINLKAPQHSTERTPPKNSNMIYYHKLERKV